MLGKRKKKEEVEGEVVEEVASIECADCSTECTNCDASAFACSVCKKHIKELE